jgi:hypothetical protein
MSIPCLIRTDVLSPGPHTLTVHYSIALTDPAASVVTVIPVSGVLQRQFEVIEGHQPLVAQRDSRSAPGVSGLTPMAMRDGSGGYVIRISVPPTNGNVQSPAIACDVLLRYGEQLHPAGGFVSSDKEWQAVELPALPGADPPDEIVLRPSRERALSQPYISVFADEPRSVRVGGR